MRYLRPHALVAVSVVILFSIAVVPSAAQTDSRRTAAPEIAFTVSMPKPHTHLLEVEMRARWNGSPPAAVALVMPVWTPGSYLVREYARHVQDFAATDTGGRVLGWSKTNKNTWRVETGGARDLVATYRVYANELTVRTNELNDQHAFWNNAALLMHVDGFLNVPATLRVVPYKDWKVVTGLPAVMGGEPNAFRAENFDVLYDSPVMAGTFQTLAFDVRGVPHRIVIDGEGNYEPERLRRDVQKIVETTVAMMGDLPYRDYTFMLFLRPTGGGGLEHLNSTALIWTRYNFRPAASYRNFLALAAHEFFHAWNVKRIRPDALGPFDYTRENYTRLLWVAEGLTDYYEYVLLRRAGLISDKEYLEEGARAIQALQNTPGRRAISLEEASFDAWIKYYRQDENSINSQISYYSKGAIVGMLLDLEIRRRSAGAKSLDDVMRYLYTEYSKKNRNFTPEDFQRACELQAGSSLEDFFRRYVRGREELDYNAAFAAAGLQLDMTGRAAVVAAGASGATKPPAEKAYLGATLAQDGDRLLVRNVPAETPAYEQGLNAGDQIVALDGVRATRDFLNARLEEKRPGDTVQLSVFRFDELRTFNIRLGGRVDAAYRILPVEQPNAEQSKIYQGWLDAPFPKPQGAPPQRVAAGAEAQP